MPGIRVRLKKSKGKRWKKGQSSNSNPEIRRHREAAKKRFFPSNSGPSGLTVEALREHDDSASLRSYKSDDDQRSLSADTFRSWATHWTECTNATFNRVHKFWNSNSALHKEILAVLAAATEVIKSREGKESETEYFAVLLTSLEATESEESMAAIMYLISIVIKRIPAPILKAKFSIISKRFIDILGAHCESNNSVLLRSTILCLAALLRVQDSVIWSDASTMQIYHSLLSFVSHSKPKIRKAVHRAICIVLKGSIFMTQSANPPKHHPAAAATAKYCVDVLEKTGGSGDCYPTLYVLNLLRDVMSSFPQQSVKTACETILRLLTLGNVLVKSTCMKALYGLFAHRPSEASMPAALNAQIIKALYDFEPNTNDIQAMVAWLSVMEKAHLNLSRLDPQLCMGYLPKLFKTAIELLESDQTPIVNATTNMAQTALKDIVAVNKSLFLDEWNRTEEKSKSVIGRIGNALEAGLSYQCRAAWPQVLHLIAILFEIVAKSCQSCVQPLLTSMANLRSTDEFPCVDRLDFAIGQAIREMGPREVLRVLPLNMRIDESNFDWNRSWMLPLLRDFTQNTELAFFTSYFLPMAAKCQPKMKELIDAGRTADAKTVYVLQHQIWSLLPGFLNGPVDVITSMKSIAKTLGDMLVQNKEARSYVLNGLRKLVHSCANQEEHTKEISRFGKNYLPILLNLYTLEEDLDKSLKQNVLETIRAFASIGDKALVQTITGKCVEKLGNPENKTPLKAALLDVLEVLVPFVESEQVELIFEQICHNWKQGDKTLEKKAYRVLAHLCKSTSEPSQAFMQKQKEELKVLLLNLIPSSAAKPPRLRCLLAFLERMQGDEAAEFIRAIMPEVLLCMKEVNSKSRTLSAGLLITMAKKWVDIQQLDEPTALKSYLELLLSGMAGSVHMVSCTTLALKVLIMEFKEQIAGDMMRVLIESMVVLLSAKPRQIVHAALEVVKLILSVFKDVTLGQYLEKILNGIKGMSEDCKKGSRSKMKQILTKLVKKFGYEEIAKKLPGENFQPQLNYIRKRLAQAKRKKALKDQPGKETASVDDDATTYYSRAHKVQDIDELLQDSDSEVDGQEEKKEKGSVKSKLKRKEAAWIKEALEEPLDLADRASAAKRVFATKPKVGTADSKKKHEFKTAPDGRLIITERPGEAAGPSKEESESGDELDELMDAVETATSKKAKKRKRADIALDDEDDDDVTFKYQAGGKGIHRPIAKNEPSEPGSEYRSKKGAGDVKRKGLPDPYAYIPLDPMALNKRKRAKVKGQFKSVVRAAPKGGAKGKALKKRQK